MNKKSKIVISMFSSSEKIKGQGVDSAYQELIKALEDFSDDFEIVFKKKSFIDIAHFHTVDFRHFLFQLISKGRIITVVTVHFLPQTLENSLNLPFFLKHIFYNYLINFYKSVDYLVVVNPNFVKELESYGIAEERITYIPNFVSDESFYPFTQEQIETERKNLGISLDKFVIFGNGQVQIRKGVQNFLEVAKKIPDTEFLWAGGFSFGKITSGYENLKKMVENPPTNVKFLGIIDRKKMNLYYNISDLFFLPSYNELFPMSILEAMACHKPLLLRDLQEYKDILNGYYLKGNEVNDFISEIKKLRINKDYYEQAKENSILGSQFYSKNNVTSKWREFYLNLYESKKQNRKNPSHKFNG